ncbi:hypothetical protein Tco_0986621 [Tanacetum coccineum]
METQKRRLKDEDGEEVDVHMYRSMIGSLMYLTSSRPDIMFAVYACARYQVNPKVSHLHAMKRIFRYLKGQPKLGLWYPKDSPFDLVAYTDSDYTRASLDKKSTTGGKAKKSVRLMMEKLFGMELELILLMLLGIKLNTAGLLLLESTVRRDLQLEDTEGIDCLPNSTIFEELTRMGSKTTAWNKFSSTMTYAIICLAINQKFNFSKYIFESMVKNLDNVSRNFLMYPRFVQVFMNQQLDGLPSHKRIYDASSHTKKIFINMKRVGKGFSGSVTPLFPIMMVQNQAELGEGSAMPIDPHHTPTIIESLTQPQKTQKPRKPKRKDIQVPQRSGPTDIVADKVVHKELGDSLVNAATTASSLEAQQDSGNITKTRSKATPNESSFLGTTSSGGPRVLDLEKTKTSQQNEIASLKRKVKKLELKKWSRTHGLKRLYKFGLSARVESFKDEEDLGEDAFKQGRRINAIDADEDITLVNVQDDAEMFDVNTLTGDEVFAEQEVAAKDVNLTIDEVTLAQSLCYKNY